MFKDVSELFNAKASVMSFKGNGFLYPNPPRNLV